jgi:hypothetical protein
MIRLKRFIRPAFIVSVIGHVGALLLGLLFVGANSFESTPPEAMVVDIVPPNEAPRLAGTPSDLRSSGSQSSSQSNSASAAAQQRPPPHKPAAQSTQQPQQPQQRSNPQRDAGQAPAQPHAAQPETAHAETVRAETVQPEAQKPSSESQPAPPQPHPEETRDQPGAAEMLAQLALVGGRLGGGFAAPPIDAARAAYDFTAPFRERVSACSARPEGIDARDNVSIKLRVSLNLDGTLASPPQLLEPAASWKQQALMQSITDALQRCQPYTMLPAERYKQWKTLDLMIFPLNLLGR